MTTHAMDRGAQSAREYDINGWFGVSDNPISREGIFPYSGAQVGSPERDRIFRVYRPAEELSRPETLASFQLMPIIDDHEMIGEGFTPAEEKGVAGVIGENVKFTDGVMTANLKIYSKALAQKIKNGKTELSCGYRCVYDFTPGVWNGQQYDAIQRSIRANHLALVDEGRMGPEVSILDQMTFTVDAKETPPVDEELKKALEALTATVTAIGERVGKLEGAGATDETPPAESTAPPPVTDEDGEKPPVAAEEVEDEGDKPKTEEAKAMDALTKQVKALSKQVAAITAKPAMDEKGVVVSIARKATLVESLKPHIGVFDHSAMTFEDVAKYAVGKLEIKNVAAGTEAIALDAYLQAKKPPVAVVTTQDSAAVSGVGKAIASHYSAKKEA